MTSLYQQTRDLSRHDAKEAVAESFAVWLEEAIDALDEVSILSDWRRTSLARKMRCKADVLEQENI